MPFWSNDTKVTDSQGTIHTPQPGHYYELGLDAGSHEIILELDMTPHFWVGGADMVNKASIYIGPMLLAYDQRFGEIGPGELPALNPESLHLAPVESMDYPEPWLLFEAESDGQKIWLCDFATAGATGMPYASWLRVKPGLPEAELDAPTPAWGYRP